MSRTTLLLDDDIRNTIFNYLRKGNTVKTACLAAGITEACFYGWVQKAEAGENIYVEFLDELKSVRRANIAERVQKIQEAGDTKQYWAANAWLLERQEPSEFARREEIAVGPSKVLIALQEQARQALEQRRMLTEGEHETNNS